MMLSPLSYVWNPMRNATFTAVLCFCIALVASVREAVEHLHIDEGEFVGQNLKGSTSTGQPYDIGAGTWGEFAPNKFAREFDTFTCPYKLDPESMGSPYGPRYVMDDFALDMEKSSVENEELSAEKKAKLAKVRENLASYEERAWLTWGTRYCRDYCCQGPFTFPTSSSLLSKNATADEAGTMGEGSCKRVPGACEACCNRYGAYDPFYSSNDPKINPNGYCQCAPPQPKERPKPEKVIEPVQYQMSDAERHYWMREEAKRKISIANHEKWMKEFYHLS